jgi:hypothetical protein
MLSDLLKNSLIASLRINSAVLDGKDEDLEYTKHATCFFSIILVLKPNSPLLMDKTKNADNDISLILPTKHTLKKLYNILSQNYCITLIKIKKKASDVCIFSLLDVRYYILADEKDNPECIKNYFGSYNRGSSFLPNI